MNKIVEEHILRQAAAIEELRRLDSINATVPQDLVLMLSGDPTRREGIHMTDNYPHCHVTRTLANRAFRLRLEQGLADYRRLLTALAETGEL